jgi:polar amino acid transport system substrate-binding protein
MILSYRCNAGFMEKDNWYQDRSVGGGRIIGEVCHFIDTLQYVTGALPTSVFARSIQTDNQATTLQDNVIISLTFDDGSVGSVTYLANGDPRFPKEYMEVFCENRVAVMDNFSQLTTMARGKRRVHKARAQDKGHGAEMAALRDAVVAGAGNPIPFESLATTTLATFRILASLERGEPVSL